MCPAPQGNLFATLTAANNTQSLHMIRNLAITVPKDPERVLEMAALARGRLMISS